MTKTGSLLKRISGKINAKTGANESNLLVTGSKNHSTAPYHIRWKKEHFLIIILM